MKTKETTLEQFTKIYSHPSAVLFRSLELRTIYENTKDIIFAHPSLDLGCGDGKIADVLFDEHFTYGVDNGEARDVQEAIENKLYEKVFLESAEKMSLSDNSVNFVFSNCVIEHIPDNEAVLRETGRIMKKDGIFIFTVPSYNFSSYLYLTNKFSSWGLGFLSSFYKYRRNKMLNQFHCYGISDWREKLARYGFKVVKYQYYADKETMMLWDKMALNIFLKNMIWPNYEKRAFKKYEEAIRKIYERKKIIEDEKGAGLFVYCKK